MRPQIPARGPDSNELTAILLAVSDNGSQMISANTRKFMAMVAIAQHSRPSRATPSDQAWIESLNGTLKHEWPHLLAITDPAVLRAELDTVRTEYNTTRLHSGIGYVTPHDEHTGRGQAIRQARQDGLRQAAQDRPGCLPPEPTRQSTQPRPPRCGLIQPPKADINAETPQQTRDGR